MSEYKISCPKCGASIAALSPTCPYCGTLIPDLKDLIKAKAELELEKERNALEIEKLKQMTKHESNPMIVKAIIFCVVMLVTLIMFLVMTHRI